MIKKHEMIKKYEKKSINNQNTKKIHCKKKTKKNEKKVSLTLHRNNIE